MADSVIKNVEKDRDGDLTYVGVSGQWKWTVAQVVSSIESRTNTFYVMCPSERTSSSGARLAAASS